MIKATASIRKLRECLQESAASVRSKADSMTTTYENRSDAWKEGDTAMEYESDMDNLSELADMLADAIDLIDNVYEF